jgi:hypothetical protein
VSPRHSTPIKNAKDHRREQEQQMSEFVHPLAMKIQKEGDFPAKENLY